MRRCPAIGSPHATADPVQDVIAPETRPPDAEESSEAAKLALLGIAVPGYEVLGLLGKGGMGVVYKARQVALGRTVALKMLLHAEHAGDDERRRFLAEAQAVASLQRPHIVQIHEVARSLPPLWRRTCSPFRSCREAGRSSPLLSGSPSRFGAGDCLEPCNPAHYCATQGGRMERPFKAGDVVILRASGVAVRIQEVRYERPKGFSRTLWWEPDAFCSWLTTDGNEQWAWLPCRVLRIY